MAEEIYPPPLQRFRPRLRGTGKHTVVLGHGIGTEQSAWDAQVEALVQAGYRVLTFDFAGATRESEHFFSPSRYETLYGLAEDILVVLQGLQIEAPVYIGHSMGGMAGLLAAVAEPARFRGLIVLGASARYLDDPASGYIGGFSTAQMEMLLQSAQEDYAQWANGFAPAMVGASNPYLSAEDFTRKLLALRPDIVHTFLRTALRADLRAEVKRLHTPLYLLQTAEDQAVPMSAARWLAEHGHARRLIEVPTQGHLPHITAPEAVNQALLACLQDLHHG